MIRTCVFRVQTVNQGLVDDGLVDKEKIGGTNYFWSFPGKRDRMLQLQHEETLVSIERLKEQITEANAKLADAKRGREDEGDDDDKNSRANKLARLAELEQSNKKDQAELEQLQQNDPQMLADLEKELKLVTEAANRWTDNIFACKSYLTKKRGMSSKEACRILGITTDFDYPE